MALGFRKLYSAAATPFFAGGDCDSAAGAATTRGTTLERGNTLEYAASGGAAGGTAGLTAGVETFGEATGDVDDTTGGSTEAAGCSEVELPTTGAGLDCPAPGFFAAD
jgi:hypothetical protein